MLSLRSPFCTKKKSCQYKQLFRCSACTFAATVLSLQQFSCQCAPRLRLLGFSIFFQVLTKEALEGFGDFKIGEQIIHTLKYTDDLVLLAKEEKLLQGMIDKLIEI